MNDLIVLIPGIGGSVLTRHGKPVWAPKPGAALHAVLTLGKTIRDLRLSGDDPAADDLGDGIEAKSVVPDLHIIPGLDWKIDGYTKLRRQLFLRFDLEEGKNYIEFPYDWRRDNRVAARRLADTLRPALAAWRAHSGNPDARVILVAHSMGGIIARLFLELNDGWKITRRLVTFGTPYSGSVNALDFLSNGFRKAWGLVDLTEMLRSFTSIYQLLPSYRCLLVGSEWKRLDDLPAIPHIDNDRLVEAMTLHRTLRETVAAAGPPLVRYDIRPVVGDTQRTMWGATLTADGVRVRYSRKPGEDGGDGTVPRLSAVPYELIDGWVNTAFFSEQHGSLQNDGPVFEHLSGVLRSQPVDLRDVFPASDVPVSLEVEDVLTTEPLVVRALPRDPVPAIEAVIEHAGNGSVLRVSLNKGADGWYTAEVPGLAAGDYRIQVSGAGLRQVTAIAGVVDQADLLRAAEG